MVVCIEAVAMPCAKGARFRDVQKFAYLREEVPGESGGDGVRDANHAHEILRLISRGPIVGSEPPRTPGHDSLFLVEIQVLGSRRTKSSYRCAYQRFNGCPAEVSEDMMNIFAAIKRVVRNCYKAIRQDEKARRARRSVA